METFHEHQPHDLAHLEDLFTEEKVWETIKHLKSDKVPGLDGFTRRFYKTCWSVIKHDVMVAIVAVQHGRVQHLDQLNSAYLTLLLKKANLWPISLINSFAKLVAKLMANMLASSLPDMISSN